jgi:hypothetical protein
MAALQLHKTIHIYLISHSHGRVEKGWLGTNNFVGHTSSSIPQLFSPINDSSYISTFILCQGSAVQAFGLTSD